MDPGIELTIKDLITFMIIVSDNTATDLLFAKTGGVDATNTLMKQYGYTKIRATAPCKAWFDALRVLLTCVEANSPKPRRRTRSSYNGLSKRR